MQLIKNLKKLKDLQIQKTLYQKSIYQTSLDQTFQMSKKQGNTDRRDLLISFEKQAQKLWEEKNCHIANPDYNNPKKYFMTFPYPYLNGRLHMGHAFSFTKCDFTARFKRMDGYNTLFAQAYHCTGMPIMAAANRLKEELETYGNPPQNLPQRLTDPKEIKKYEQENKKDYVFKEPQYNTLLKMNIPAEEIPKFVDPYFWTSYFPPYAQEDLTSFGAPVDFRRSFITTDKNPYYNNFIEWQFSHLHEQKKVVFGKRPSIFSTKDNQMIADHDRSSGEGLNPQEYTLIKMKVLEFPGKLEALKGRNVYLVCGTLRPETMYGQTNCYILPTGNYGAFEMKDDEVFICSERSAKNMAYQDLSKTPEKIEKIGDFLGTDIIGIPIKAPLSSYDKVYVLPMMTIKMDKGTGVVTSVPSDSPDDFASLRDLQNKAPLREKFGLTDDMVLPFNPVPIIDIPELGDLSAVKACEEFKVKSQNNAKELALAKEKCYTKGFYEGVLKVGDFAGKKVQDAKPLVREQLLKSKEAAIYWEPEGQILSRTGDECIVSFIDQWYLNYADENWKKEVMDHVKSDKFRTYNPQVQENLEYTIDWLKEWGCSRAFGLGTTLPFDKRFLIESLSDSTIYMAYYTIAHLIQGNVDGSKPGELGISADKFNREVFDYIYLDKEYDSNTMQIEEEKLQRMRKEFNYWYPMDLRCSGKDLVRNHLTMCLFNHAAIWKDSNKWPKSIFCNGWILVNGKKMAKSEGNFYTIDDIVTNFGADASRFACAEAGDSLDDANFMVKNADEAILKMSNIVAQLEKTVAKADTMRTSKSENPMVNYFDEYFESEINNFFFQAIEAYNQMRFRDALKYSFHEWNNLKEDYIQNCGDEGLRVDLIFKYYHLQTMVLYPITPHFCEVMYMKHIVPLAKIAGQNIPEYLYQNRYPQVSEIVINKSILRSYYIFKKFLREKRVEAQKKSGVYQGKLKQGQKAEKKEGIKFSKLVIVYAAEYFPWQLDVLKVLQESEWDQTNLTCKSDWKKVLINNPELKGDKALLGKALSFGQSIVLDYKFIGADALETQVPFDEKALYNMFAETIKKEVGDVQELEIVINAEAPQNDPQYKEALQSVMPKKAQIILIQ